MKFNFKIQDYQTDAVESVVRVFNGQPNINSMQYIIDKGKTVVINDGKEVEQGQIDLEYIGYRNNDIMLNNVDLLSNIHRIQTENNIKLSKDLVTHLGHCSLDVEMETGTGKTYVYIKTMFELNKRYGWTKFIVVVPSIAIREGVKKSFEMTTDHFMEQYGKKARFFIYDSSNLNKIDTFSSSGDVSVMIINTQAFAASLKEGGRSKESRIIYSKRDDFASRRPIDVIKANQPIIILDEPQKMGGEITQNALKQFNPLFSINYSATHKVQHNMIYVLDALDAYNKRLVKKIEVKGFEVKNLKGTNKYLFLEDIVLSSNKPPMARMEFEVKHDIGIKREIRILGVGDDLYYMSNNMEQYKGFKISDIDPISNSVTFLNDERLSINEASGDVSEKNQARIQIRETILSHFKKEELLFNKGIKTLSLFFIDEVAKYRQYDDNGKELLGEYGKMFEDEYTNILNENLSLFDSDYQEYLRNIPVNETHKGYFSIDNKGHVINSKVKRGSEFSDDISAYDLIMKNKERLLSFEEPVRFIFSHSALREGWDNPNIFQICALKHSDSATQKRQEVGRGLRLCVNKDGDRMDYDTLGERVHDINKLTVIAAEGYASFVGDLQKDIRKDIYDRPTKATEEYFIKKVVKVNGQLHTITEQETHAIYRYLLKNDYIDDNDKITEKYHVDLGNNTLVPLPESILPITEGVHKLIQSVFDEHIFDDMIEDANTTQIKENKLNDNFSKKEFQELWRRINHKYAYTVAFDSAELIDNSIRQINKDLFVSELQYRTTVGEQDVTMDRDRLDRGDAFGQGKTNTNTLKVTDVSHVKYDLIGKIAAGTTLTRKTVVRILQGIKPSKFAMFQANPEEFISKVTKLIKEQKATMIVDHISYNQIDGKYESDIFTKEKHSQGFDKAYKATKHIQDYVFTDGTADKSVERKFAEDLDNANEVVVYAKLPKGFHIPTPVGNYSPDWAIAFKKGTVKHIYFIAETKGTLDSLEFRPIEKSKINCAIKLFNEMSTSEVKYSAVKDYATLMNVMEAI